VKNPREFMSNLKIALFPEEVYVFTPKGEVKAFPKGATPIDFAYSIHTDVGHTCIGAKVNRSIVPLKYQLKNGDSIEIITQAGHHPSKDWLKYAVTSKALSKIRNWVKAEELEKSLSLGQDLLEKEFRKHNLKLGQMSKSPEMQEIMKEIQVASFEDLLSAVGYGRISPKHVARYFLVDEDQKKTDTPEKKEKKTSTGEAVGVSLTGLDDIMIRFAKCCNPIPGDEIIGYISRGRGIIVHTTSCPHVRNMDQERLVNVQWNVTEKKDFQVNMKVVCHDSKGILAEISSAISALDVNIESADVDTDNNSRVTCLFGLNVGNLKQFNDVVSSVRKLRGIISVERVKPI
jgi:GTP pyrophosphokinase